MFSGSFTALITPFKQGKLDEKAFVAIIERQLKAGTHGLVPAGTTGESPTLDHDEHNEVTRVCVQAVAGKAKVLAGTGSNATHEAIALTQAAQDMGVDGALVVVPYYNKPSQEGLYQLFKAVHDNSDIPIILYNVPGRSVADLSQETILRLAELPRIAGVKDATGDLKRPADLIKRLPDAISKFDQLSGEDDSVVEFYRAGGNGCISVTSNIAAEECAEMHNALLAGDFETGQAIQDRLMPLHNILFCESSPGPVKYAAHLLGLCSDEIRLPLVMPSEENKKKIREVLEGLGII